MNTLELHQIASSYLQCFQHNDCYALMAKHKDAPSSFRKALLATISEYISAAVQVCDTEPMLDDMYDIGDLCGALRDARMALSQDLPMSLVFSVPGLVWLAQAAWELGEDKVDAVENDLGNQMSAIAKFAVLDNT